MILTYAGKRLLKVSINVREVDPKARLWKFIDRIEELECWFGTVSNLSFLASLGPASNLKVFQLQDGLENAIWGPQLELPRIFRGDLPVLREVRLKTSVTCPTGLFKNLRTFELGDDTENPFSPTHVLDVLRESPSLENLNLVGCCHPSDDELPAVALPSLENCTLAGNGAVSLIWHLGVPASAKILLTTSPPAVLGRVEFYPFPNLCLSPYFHTLDGVSTILFFIGPDEVEFKIPRNDSGGSLKIVVPYDINMIFGLIILTRLLGWPPDGSCCKFQTTKEFVLHIQRGTSPDDLESVLSSSIFDRFISGLPSLERVELRGVPTRALSYLLLALQGNQSTPYPNLQRLDVESTPLRSPRTILGDLDRLIKWRKYLLGLPLQLVDARVNCETLITIAEHSAFLMAWGGFVGEDVRVGYSRDKVENLTRRIPAFYFGGGENDAEDEEGSEEADVVEPGGSDLDWESWNLGQWPKAASEMKGAAVPITPDGT